MEVFGAGGGQTVAESLSQTVGARVPLLGQVPLDTRLRAGGDLGRPIVVAEPEAPAAQQLAGIARTLSGRGRNLAGLRLGLTPAGKF
jgi:ATP-binding protein involved in chromosome partitioning